jgi:hypothetical protein
MNKENLNYEKMESIELQIGPFFMSIPISFFRGGKS